MIKFVEITERGPTPGMAKRHFNAILRDCLFRMGKFWQRYLLKEHFTRRGARKYNYTPRSGERGRSARHFTKSYTGRKLWERGHTDPLVWTGLSRLRSRYGNIAATFRKVRVSINAPGLNRRYAGSKIDMVREVTEVSPDEFPMLVKIYDRTLDTRLRRITGENKRVIR